MLQKEIKELFYSNGVDIFGPVSLEEFCSNKYYKSTKVWYEGLTGWLSIGDCEEFKHLIGTMPTSILNSGMATSIPDQAPPLSEMVNIKPGSNNIYITTAVFLLALLIALTTIYFNRQVASEKTQAKSIIADTLKADSAHIKEAELAYNIKLEAEKKTYRMNWEKFIAVTPNDFNLKEIGGIKNLKVIVKNSSPYNLDSVKVKVDYIKLNGDIYQTEIMQFDNVPPAGSKELFAPNSNRGVNIICSIITLNSTSMNICFNKKDKALAKKTGEDSYRCP